MNRCPWREKDPLYIKYHDQEWGVPVHDDKKLFEFLILEGAQAGLSWLTILKRREGYRKAFANFNVNKVAKFTYPHGGHAFGLRQTDQPITEWPRLVERWLKTIGVVESRKLKCAENEG